MSVDSLIDQWGKTCTIKRPTVALDSGGNPTNASYATTSVTGYIQVGGGNTGLRWGGERNRYEATGYFKDGVDIKESDYVAVTLDSLTRVYRVESKIIRDERSTGDSMRYITVGLQEDMPRT